MNSAEILIKFKGDTSEVDRKTKTLGSSMGNLTRDITLGNLAAKGIAKGFQIMGNHMDDAISRVDTMNNFPKVMENMGISAKDSDKAIKTLSDKLTGLPTTLDSAASSVQRFTSKNGDVKKSTDLFLAVNDAILAGGAPAEQQASAMEQLSQAYSKGKPDMMEWRSIQSVMPAQLKQIATQMGYAGGNVDKLGEDLRNGKVPMDDFMDAVVELDKNGGNGFKSFQEQAKASTGGIGTSIQNLKTAITRGLANAFNEVDKSLKKSGMGGISGVVKQISKAITDLFKALTPLIPPALEILKVVIKIAPFLLGLIGIIALINTGMKVYAAVQTALRVATMLSAAAQWLLNTALFACPITWIVLGIMALVAVFIILWKKCAWFRNFWKALWEGIKTTAKAAWEGIKTAFTTAWNAIKKVFTTIINFVKNNWKEILLFLINPFAGAFAYLYKHSTKFRNFINNVVNKIVGFFKAIPGKIKALPGKIVNTFKTLPNKMLNVGKNMIKGLWNGAKNMKDWAIEKIKGLGKSILKGMKKVLGIKSPSKEFALIGKYSVMGYTEGIDKMKSDIQDKINSTFSLSPSVVGSASNHYSPNINVNVENNMNMDPLGQVVNKVKTFSGGAKNDYNYGR